MESLPRSTTNPDKPPAGRPQGPRPEVHAALYFAGHHAALARRSPFGRLARKHASKAQKHANRARELAPRNANANHNTTHGHQLAG